MIELLDPVEIARDGRDVLEDLARFGIDHGTTSPRLGWNYALDHVWFVRRFEEILPGLGAKPLVLDVGCGISPFHDYLERRFDLDIVGIDRPSGHCAQKKGRNVDHRVDFLECEVFPPGSVDLVCWVSALEHNPPPRMAELVAKSMACLRPGGWFLATVAAAATTHWFEPSQQSNLSPADLRAVFGEEELRGELDEIRGAYRRDVLKLASKYRRRYRWWGLAPLREEDPVFVVAAVSKRRSS